MEHHFANMSPMVTKAVKGAAVGAGVGFVLWLGRQIMPRSNGAVAFAELNEFSNSVMLMDLDFRSMCLQLQPFAKFEPETYHRVLLGAAKLIHMHVGLQRQELRATFGMHKQAAVNCSEIVEAVRRLRAIVSHRTQSHVKVMEEFDEVAADLQRKCNEYMHNITMSIQYALSF